MLVTVQLAREPLILSVDTTTDVRSVAVVAGGRVRAQTTSSLRGAQAASLLNDVDATLNEASVGLKEIDLFAVATGPGSFTGLRTGIATIKALAATLHKPIVGMPTLHAVAHAVGREARIVAALPAGRGELFVQLLAVSHDGIIEELSSPAHLAPIALLERALAWPPPLIWAGAGAHVQAEAVSDAALRGGYKWLVESDKVGLALDEFGGEGARVWTLARLVSAYAAGIAAQALTAYRAGRTLGAEELRALYVRLSDAELNERCRV